MRRADVGSAPRLSEVRFGEPRPRTAPHRTAGPPLRSLGPPRSTSAAVRLSARPPGAPETKEARGLSGPRRARLGAGPHQGAGQERRARDRSRAGAGQERCRSGASSRTGTVRDRSGAGLSPGAVRDKERCGSEPGSGAGWSPGAERGAEPTGPAPPALPYLGANSTTLPVLLSLCDFTSLILFKCPLENVYM